MSRLNDLLRQLDTSDPALAKDLRREVEALTDRRAFGLNFERHMPEVVELPGRKVRRGDKVHVLAERGTHPGAENTVLWRVAAIDRTAESPVATLERDDAAPIEVALDALVVVAEFRDPIYPGLVSTGKVERGGDTPFHTVIKAENHHALQTLLFTHRGQVDCIYIDPPYNTGNDGWIYNDKYVAGDDLYKHSKWLAFMERRLLLAKELLKPTGVIIVAIGDEEHHRLRMLMDQVFDAQNFISDVVWQGGLKNDSRLVSNGADYMLIYGHSVESMRLSEVRWRETKPGAEEAILAGNRAWAEAALGEWRKSGEAIPLSGGRPIPFADVSREFPDLVDNLDATGITVRESLRGVLQQVAAMSPEIGANVATTATKAMKSWARKHSSDYGSGVTRFVDVDPADGRIYNADRPIDWPGGGGPRYDVIHPTTGRPCAVPSRGWMYADPARMQEEIDAGRIAFGPDESKIPRGKTYLVDSISQVAMSVFDQRRLSGMGQVRSVLGDSRFPNPKDHQVLGRWLRLTSPTDALILDFFGGSGTTAEAVMRLNAADGGTRRCILVTNNEVAAADAKKLRKAGHRPGDPEWEAKGVYEYVAKPRIETVATGIRPDGSTYSDGLEQNVEFFDLTYEAPLRVSTNREFAKVAPLLWMRAGSQGRRIDDLDAGWDVADSYGVIADLDQSERFLKAVAEGGDAIRMAFIVTDEDRLFQTICRELPDHVEPVRLYEAYLRNFEIESGRSSR